MKSAYRGLKKTSISLLLGCCVTAQVFADDIEIYTDANLIGAVAQPNIMFIMDSSLPMDNTLASDVPYDYTHTYDVAGGYDDAYIYYTSDGSIPATNGGYFNKTANYCDHAVKNYVDGAIAEFVLEVVIDPDTLVETEIMSVVGPLYTTGMYSGQIAQFDNSANQSTRRVWRTLRTNNAAARALPIDCLQDHGIHGNGDGKHYIASGTNGGWTNADDGTTAATIWANNANNYFLYTGNYLNYLVDPLVVGLGGQLTLFEQLKSAIATLVLATSNINIGLMQYDTTNYTAGVNDDPNGNEGGAVIYPLRDVNLGRQNFYTAGLNNMAIGIDPVISETYFEALKYFGGDTIVYGNLASPSTTGDAKDGGSGNYETPITETCQKNYIIVVSNGLSGKDYVDEAKRGTLTGFDTNSCNTGAYNGALSNQDAFTSEASTVDNCLDEMAEWALLNDVATRSDKTAHEGDQNITTYTIGFAFPENASQELLDGEQLLKDTARRGGGRFIEARDEADLVKAFNELVSEILKVNSTFSSPAVSVNAFNRATNLDDLYFTLFKPASGEHWEGNIKKFKLEFANSLPFIADSNHAAAIDSTTGFFKDSSVSYWTQAADAPDGAETAKGGAAGNISLTRNVYTFTGSYSGTVGVLTPSVDDLTAASNELIFSNANITDAMLGNVADYTAVDYYTAGALVATPYSYHDALLKWAFGYDIKDDDADMESLEARRIMGDPLHAEPGLVQYGLTGAGAPDLVAYVATNDGYLHAFDTINGTENFAFVPQEMLPKLQNIFDDTGVNGKAYGLDGNVVSWINDVNRDGTISGTGEHVYLYFGMRRGGHYLYSMDVTDRNAPKLRWVLEGGTGDYAEMGQTWSSPNVEKINIGGVDRTVLIFGAGYDDAQDALVKRGADNVGRGIFIVDADTGALLWRAGPDGGANLQLTDMVYSIPARIKPIDIDGDGYTERLYAGDMGGQLWRIDIDNDANTTSSLSVTGGRIADFAVDNLVADARRFYNPPDAALILEQGKTPYIAILAASGFRAHPLQTAVHDRVYMMRDYDVYTVPATYTTVTEADLYDTTSNLIGEGTTAEIIIETASLSGKKGWFITFSEMDDTFVGEKALSEPLILNGVAIFTTFIPASAGLTSNSCKANDGTGAIYFVNVVDGTPTSDNNADSTTTRVDRRILLARGGIPPTPRVIITEDGIPTLCVGTECTKAGEVGTVQKMYWYEVEE